MTVGEKIKRLRLQKGLSQEEFAKKAGVCKQSVSLWERGKMIPRISAANKLSEVFHVEFSEFLSKKDAIAPHWVSVKERLPEESKPYVCQRIFLQGCGACGKSRGKAAGWCQSCADCIQRLCAAMSGEKASRLWNPWQRLQIISMFRLIT